MKKKTGFLLADNQGNGVIAESIILTLEMSFASPGINSAWVILFASLALPSEYVGIFAVYKMLTTNFGSACSMLCSALEQIELSDALGEMDKTVFLSGNNS